MIQASRRKGCCCNGGIPGENCSEILRCTKVCGSLCAGSPLEPVTSLGSNCVRVALGSITTMNLELRTLTERLTTYGTPPSIPDPFTDSITDTCAWHHGWVPGPAQWGTGRRLVKTVISFPPMAFRYEAQYGCVGFGWWAKDVVVTLGKAATPTTSGTPSAIGVLYTEVECDDTEDVTVNMNLSWQSGGGTLSWTLTVTRVDGAVFSLSTLPLDVTPGSVTFTGGGTTMVITGTGGDCAGAGLPTSGIYDETETEDTSGPRRVQTSTSIGVQLTGAVVQDDCPCVECDDLMYNCTTTFTVLSVVERAFAWCTDGCDMGVRTAEVALELYSVFAETGGAFTRVAVLGEDFSWSATCVDTECPESEEDNWHSTGPSGATTFATCEEDGAGGLEWRALGYWGACGGYFAMPIPCGGYPNCSVPFGTWTVETGPGTDPGCDCEADLFEGGVACRATLTVA